MFLIGLAIIISLIGFVVAMGSIVRDTMRPYGDNRNLDGFIWGGLAAGVLPWVVLAVLWAFGMMLGWVNTDPDVREGACYEAVGKDSTYFIQSGKVMIPVNSRNVYLVEIPC